jgi:uncharacterized protein (TIRG00374 family)
MNSAAQPAFEEPPEITEKARRNPYVAFALKTGLGVAVVAILLWRNDPRPIFHLLRRERPVFFSAAVVIFLTGQVMSAYRWQLLARLNHIGGPYREYLAYYFIGMFTNLFVPAGLVGGDTARAVYLGRKENCLGESIASVVADRGVGLLALFWLAAVCALFLDSSTLPANLVHATLTVGAISFIGWLASPLLGRFAASLSGRLGAFVAPMFAYLRRPPALLPAIALSLILQTSIVVCQYLIAVGLGLHIGLGTFMLIVPIANVAASLPVTLNGLGVREATYVVLFGMAGVPKTDAIALGLLWFAATMLCGMTGALAFMTTEVPGPAAAVPASATAAAE